MVQITAEYAAQTLAAAVRIVPVCTKNTLGKGAEMALVKVSFQDLARHLKANENHTGKHNQKLDETF